MQFIYIIESCVDKSLHRSRSSTVTQSRVLSPSRRRVSLHTRARATSRTINQLPTAPRCPKLRRLGLTQLAWLERLSLSNHPAARPLLHSFIHSFIHSLTHSFTHAVVHSRMHSCINSPVQ